MFANRIQSFEGGGLKVQLGAAAASKLKAARRAELAGQPDLATKLRDEAQLLISAAQPVASQYEDLRLQETPSWERTAKLERLVENAREMASSFAEPRAVEQLFDSGKEGNRIIAIAMMQANPALWSVRVAAEAIEKPKSAFEQYHALRAAQTLVAEHPDSASSIQLRDVIYRGLKGGQFGAQKSARCNLAVHILSMIPASEESHKDG
jgi:hypothetical protein